MRLTIASPSPTPPALFLPSSRGGTIERLEDPGELIRSDSRAGVFDRQDRRIAVPESLDEDRRSRLAILAGVVEQVVEQLTE
jgi:hypothetical protein